jgi:hypothetical protein
VSFLAVWGEAERALGIAGWAGGADFLAIGQER